MTWRSVINSTHFMAILRQLRAAPGRPMLMPVGISFASAEILATDAATNMQFIVALSEQFSILVIPPNCLGALLVGNGPLRGQATGFVSPPGRVWS